MIAVAEQAVIQSQSIQKLFVSFYSFLINLLLYFWELLFCSLLRFGFKFRKRINIKQIITITSEFAGLNFSSVAQITALL